MRKCEKKFLYFYRILYFGKSNKNYRCLQDLHAHITPHIQTYTFLEISFVI